MKVKLKELFDDRYGARYVVRSYYDSALKGLEDSIKTNDWEEVEDFAHEHLSNGGYVKITDRKTGVEKTLDNDTYFGEGPDSYYEGEFPYSPLDFDSSYYDHVKSFYEGTKSKTRIKKACKEDVNDYWYSTKHTPDSVYWYSTKHGFGPGAFPSGATILDVVEDDENPYKIYIATDKLLNTKALNDFDLKEERPNGETRFSTKDFTNMHFTGKRNREK